MRTEWFGCTTNFPFFTPRSPKGDFEKFVVHPMVSLLLCIFELSINLVENDF
jgi:hypothetical protein